MTKLDSLYGCNNDLFQALEELWKDNDVTSYTSGTGYKTAKIAKVNNSVLGTRQISK